MVLSAIAVIIPALHRVVPALAVIASLLVAMSILVELLNRMLTRPSVIFLYIGASIMTMGLTLMATSSGQSIAIVTIDVGLLIVMATLALSNPTFVGMQPPASKLLRWLLWFLALFFALMVLRNIVGGAIDLYHCPDFSRSLGTLIGELIGQSSAQMSTAAVQNPTLFASAHVRCLGGLLGLISAAACGFGLVAVLRYLKLSTSRQSPDSELP